MPMNLETTPLELKTGSMGESWDKIVLHLYTAEEDQAGEIEISVSNNPQYKLNFCGLWTKFPNGVSTGVENIWRFSLIRRSVSETRVEVHCNDVEVLNIVLSDEICSEMVWRYYWNKDVEKVYLHEYSIHAVDSYRLYQQGSGKWPKNF